MADSNLQLINKIISSGKLITLGKPYEEAYSIFPDIIKEEYEYIHKFYKKYGKVPEKETFLEEYDNWELGACEESDEFLINSLEESMLYQQSLAYKEAADTIVNNSFDGHNAMKEVLEKNEEFIQKYFSQQDQIPTFEELLKKSIEKEQECKIETGFPEMDKDIGGLRKGNEVAIIVARTGVGKSWVLQKMALSAYMDKSLQGNIGIISPEMDPIDMASRMYILFKHTNYKESDDLSDFFQKDKQLKIVTPSQISPVFTYESIKRFIKKENITALYIDGISYVKTGNSKTDEADVTRLGQVTRELMLISDEYKIPIVGVVQANRDAAREITNCPDLSTIRGCDEISHIATIIYSLAKDNECLKIKIAKNRRGKTGDTYIYNWNIATGQYNYVETNSYTDETDEERQDRRSREINKQVEISMENTRRRGQKPTIN